jgi:hypothetical protein
MQNSYDEMLKYLCYIQSPPVPVSGYTRRNGTYVHSHIRGYNCENIEAVSKYTTKNGRQVKQYIRRKKR